MTTNKPEVRVFRPSAQAGCPAMRIVFPSDRVSQDNKYVRLSDYEALQAELERLKEYAEFGKAVQQKREPGKRYGCHCDLEEGMEPDECVIDEGKPHHCIYAKHISAKEQCEYWRVITSDANQEQQP